MSLLEKFKAFEISNLEKINGGKGVVTWSGSDGKGNSLIDIHDDVTGEDFCSVNDFDLGFGTGDVVYNTQENSTITLAGSNTSTR